MLWLGKERGYLTDWITQVWVRMTGRRVYLSNDSWLQGVVGPTTGIGKGFFHDLAKLQGLEVRQSREGGLLQNFNALSGSLFNAAKIDPSVRQFYEHTASYDLDAWAEWCGAFRPFGWLLAFLFSRRLQQLNVPLSGLDTSRGITSEVLQLVIPGTGEVRYTAWVRQLRGSGNVLYAGSYSVCRVPGHANPCVKVVFPLPNGNAMVLMRPEAHADGSVSLTSAGKSFGDPGFYFTVHTRRGVYARYVRALRESIQVYPDNGADVRADHELTYFGIRFLKLHYRLRRRRGQTPPAIGTN